MAVTDESDTVFNTAYHWDSYRGPLRPGIQDFHRVALHEFGHMLGLDHPDEHGQTVPAIMNSVISNIGALQPDDIAGVKSLYDDGPRRAICGRGARPGKYFDARLGRCWRQRAHRWIHRARDGTGHRHPARDRFFAECAGFHDRPARSADDDLRFESATRSRKTMTGLSVPTRRPLRVTTSIHRTVSNRRFSDLAAGRIHRGHPKLLRCPTARAAGIGLFELYDLHTTGGRAGNISTRGQVLGGDNVLIGGFIVGGSDDKTVVARAHRAVVRRSGVANPLADPTTGIARQQWQLVQSNDDWGQGADAHDDHAPTVWRRTIRKSLRCSPRSAPAITPPSSAA